MKVAAPLFEWGLRPRSPGIYRFPARMTGTEAALPPPLIPAAESALGLRPRSALIVAPKERC